MVMLFHFSQAANWSLRGSPLVAHADLLVTFFFVLSGFVISHAYEERLATRDAGVIPFMLRRFGRLYPLHVATLGALLLWALVRPAFDLGPVFDGDLYDMTAIFTNLLLLQGLGVENHFTWNFPSWSISTEFYTYVIFALIWALLGARAIIAVACIFVAAIAFNLTSTLPIVSVGMLTNCIAGFAAGALTQRVYRATWRENAAVNRIAATIAEIAAVIVVLATMLFGCPFQLTPLAYAPVVYVFACERGWISAFLRTHLPRQLGLLSYSVYMNHVVVLTVTASLLLWWGGQSGIGLVGPIAADGRTLIGANIWIGNLVIAGMIALTLLLSTLTYRFIEAPGRDWGGRLAERWRKRSGAAIPTAGRADG